MRNDRSPVDFKALKAITFEQAIDFLKELEEPKREGDQLRFACPACRDGNKRALSVNPDKGFQCFSGKKTGNDAVALVSHVRAVTSYEAGRLFEEHFLNKRQVSRAPSAAKATVEGRSVPNIPASVLLRPQLPRWERVTTKPPSASQSRFAPRLAYRSASPPTQSSVCFSTLSLTRRGSRADPPSRPSHHTRQFRDIRRLQPCRVRVQRPPRLEEMARETIQRACENPPLARAPSLMGGV